jgi:hypothetical protein
MCSFRMRNLSVDDEAQLLFSCQLLLWLNVDLCSCQARRCRISCAVMLFCIGMLFTIGWHYFRTNAYKIPDAAALAVVNLDAFVF